MIGLEDPSRRRRSRLAARGLLVIGFAFALIAGFLTYRYASDIREEAQRALPASPLVVAARDIPIRTALSAGDLKVVRVDPSILPKGAFQDPGALVGRVVTVPIAANEPVLPGKFADVGAGAANFSVFPAGQTPTGGAPEFRAVSFTIPDAQAVGGAVQPGDLVDILLTFQFDPARFAAGAPTPPAKPGEVPIDIAARTTFEKVPVLARTLQNYTFRLDLATTERIAVLTTGGATMQLLLRAPGDERDVRTTGTLFNAETADLLRRIGGKIR